MQRDLAVYLIDIQQCLDELAIFVKGKTLTRSALSHRILLILCQQDLASIAV